jgi:anaerobic magnesium-protoporphyrin IX monomethyl ester cyclase
MLNIPVGHSYFLTYDRKQWERGKPYPPLATIQVAALLREMGRTASLFDAMLADNVDDYHASLQAARPHVVVIYEDNFNYLTKMCLGRMREAACQMIAEARAHSARVIVAGLDASDHPDVFLAAGADAVLIGEGIAALVELIERLDLDPDIATAQWTSGIAGVATLVDGQTQLMGLCAQPPDSRLAGRPATWSTSNAIASCGTSDTATSASTWQHRAAVRSVASGAPSRSGATATSSAIRRTSRRR